jgi:hypothetical protein
MQESPLDHRVISWWRGFERRVVSFGRGIVQKPGCLIASRHLGCDSHVVAGQFVVLKLARSYLLSNSDASYVVTPVMRLGEIKQGGF